MITMETLLCNTKALLLLLFHMITLWPWGVIKFFLPKKRKDITGEIMFVTGAGSGIGRYMSIKFAELGAILICTDLNRSTAEETANMIKSNGGTAYSYQLDVTDRDQVYKLAEQVKRDVGEVTMLVNNAGIVTGKHLMDCPDELMIKTMETLKSFIGPMLKKNKGHVITIASIAGIMGAPGLVDYCASKFAAVGIHDSLTTELTKNPENRIKTSVVCPYMIKTGMFDGVVSSCPYTFPLVEVDDAVNQIVAGVLNEDVEIFIPKHIMIVGILKSLAPSALGRKMLDYIQLHDQMANFKGRKKED